MADAWWQNKGCSVDLRDPMGCTYNYTANNVGTGVYDVKDSSGVTQHATITASDTLANKGTITIELPAGYFAGGGYRNYSKVVRALNETDVARFGGVVTNVAANAADDEATYRPLAVWLW